jgi:hypothetical protein
MKALTFEGCTPVWRATARDRVWVLISFGGGDNGRHIWGSPHDVVAVSRPLLVGHQARRTRIASGAKVDRKSTSRMLAMKPPTANRLKHEDDG